MKRSIFSLSALALAASVMSFSPSAARAEVKLAVVNFDAVMQESPQLKAMQQTLQNEFAPRERDLTQQQKDIKAKMDKFQKDAATMTDADKGKLEREIREGQRDLERRTNEFKEDANNRQNEEIQKLQRAVAAEVQAYAKSQNFDLVLIQGVLYASESLNITPQVIAAIQAKSAKSAPAAAPAAAPAKK